MSKVVLFVILDQFADWEGAYLSVALKVLGDQKYSPKTVSLSKDPVESIGGLHVIPDFDLEHVPDEFEAVILVGGMSWHTEGAKRVIPLVHLALSKNKVVGGICNGAAFLGAIGVLNNVHHTSNAVEDVKNWEDSVYTGESLDLRQQAVRDGNVVTANGTGVLEFTREVLLALNATNEKKIVDFYRFHKLGPYEMTN